MRRSKVLFLLLIGLAASDAFAASDDHAAAQRIRIEGRSQATITTPQILLGDIADISSPEFTDDEAVIALRRIGVASSPMPGESIRISGTEIVSKMRMAGVELNRVGYSFPREVSVSRASRTLGLDEVRRVVEEMFQKSGRDIEIRDLQLGRQVEVAPGDITIEARPAGVGTNGSSSRINLDITVRSPTVPEIRVPTVAMVTEWSEVPIATRSLPKGAVVEDQDLERARVNLSSLPRDVAMNEGQIVGLEIKQDIAVGEVFRRDKMIMPVVVAAGSKVTMMVRTKFFDATATGIAIEPGMLGQEIKVRNETSKRVVSAIVKERGLVEVVQ